MLPLWTSKRDPLLPNVEVECIYAGKKYYGVTNAHHPKGKANFPVSQFTWRFGVVATKIFEILTFHAKITCIY